MLEGKTNLFWVVPPDVAARTIADRLEKRHEVFYVYRRWGALRPRAASRPPFRLQEDRSAVTARAFPSSTARSRAGRGLRPLQLLRVRRSTGPSSVEELAAVLAGVPRARRDARFSRRRPLVRRRRAESRGAGRRADAAERDPQPRRRDGDRPRGRGAHARRPVEGRRPAGVLAARRDGHDARHARRRRRRERPRQERLEARDDRRPRRERHASCGADGTLEEIGGRDSRDGRRRREHARRGPGRRGRASPQEAPLGLPRRRGLRDEGRRRDARGASTAPRTTGNTSSAGWTAGRPGARSAGASIHVANEHVPAPGRADGALRRRAGRRHQDRPASRPAPPPRAQADGARPADAPRELGEVPRRPPGRPGAVPPVARRVLVPSRLRARLERGVPARRLHPVPALRARRSAPRKRSPARSSCSRKTEVVSSLAVVKRHRADASPRGYAPDGFSLALDFPVTRCNAGRLVRLCRGFDRVLLETGGHAYRAKDCVGTRGAPRGRAERAGGVKASPARGGPGGRPPRLGSCSSTETPTQPTSCVPLTGQYSGTFTDTCGHEDDRRHALPDRLQGRRRPAGRRDPDGHGERPDARLRDWASRPAAARPAER